MKTKFTIGLILLALFQACGDDKSSTKSVKHYPILSSNIGTYQGGEHLKYSFSFTSGKEDQITGTEDIYIYSGYSLTGRDEEGFKQVTFFDSPQSTSTNDFFFYDSGGNYIHYLTGNGYYYTNRANSYAGVLAMPSSLYLGQSWTNSYMLIIFNEDRYDGSLTYTVVSKETISVPIGQVECYKITYAGHFLEKYFSGNQYELNINGTIWVHPQIGIIKTQETTERGFWEMFTPHVFNNKLVSINWDI